jgi:dolichol kinase
VPIAWDSFFSELQTKGIGNQWAAVGVNDATHFISLVILNQSSVASIFTVSVYDSSGALAGQGTTPSIAGSNAATLEGGTQGVLLSTLVPNLPSGVVKITVNGGANPSSVSVLQFNGDSATSLQVSYDAPPNSGVF